MSETICFPPRGSKCRISYAAHDARSTRESSDQSTCFTDAPWPKHLAISLYAFRTSYTSTRRSDEHAANDSPSGEYFKSVTARSCVLIHRVRVNVAASRTCTPRRTVHGGKDVCGFRARAPEDGASTRAERLLRSSDRRAAAKLACAGTRQKSQRYINQGYPAKCREISRALDRHRGRKTERSKAQESRKVRIILASADWTSRCGVSRNARKCPMSVKTRRR